MVKLVNRISSLLIGSIDRPIGVFITLFFTGVIYIILIPISFFHYRYLNKKSFISSSEEEETEDVL